MPIMIICQHRESDEITERSRPVNFSKCLSRRDVEIAFRNVWEKGPRSPGRDGFAFGCCFGKGLDDSRGRVSLRSLLARRHDFKLMRPRITQIEDLVTEKTRDISIFTYKERILFRALANKLRAAVPLSKINVCRPGLDARWSVRRSALHLRSGCLHTHRLDVRRAFDTVQWPQIIKSNPSWQLQTGLLVVLEEVLSFLRPDGAGIPTGAAFSPALLDLALTNLDQHLIQNGHLAFRYLDDVLVLFQDEDAVEDIRLMAEGALAPLGLELHPEKSLPFLQAPRSLEGNEKVWFPWLGHALSLDGDIDISQDTAKKFLADEEKHTGEALAAWCSHFELAQRGSRYRETLAEVAQ